MTFLARVRRWFRSREEDPREVLASLLLAAREDQALRRQVLFVLEAPPLQRASLINTAVHEMTLCGESAAAQAAFAFLATEAGARAAREALQKE